MLPKIKAIFYLLFFILIIYQIYTTVSWGRGSFLCDYIYIYIYI